MRPARVRRVVLQVTPVMRLGNVIHTTVYRGRKHVIAAGIMQQAGAPFNTPYTLTIETLPRGSLSRNSRQCNGHVYGSRVWLDNHQSFSACYLYWREREFHQRRVRVIFTPKPHKRRSQ